MISRDNTLRPGKLDILKTAQNRPGSYQTLAYDPERYVLRQKMLANDKFPSDEEKVDDWIPP